MPEPGLGGAGIVAVLTLLIASSTAAWGWTHTGTGGSSPTGNVTPCTVLQPGTQLTQSAVGSQCPGFAAASTAFQLDCRTIASLPNSLDQGSYDLNKKADGGGATIAVRTDGCHFQSPAYQIESYFESGSKLDPGPLLLVADFVPSSLPGYSGFLFGCDGHCIDTDFESDNKKVYVYEDGQSLAETQVQSLVGTNRLVVAYQGQKVRVWMNGTLVTTQALTRVRGAGNYYWFLVNLDKSQPADSVLVQMAIYKLAA